MFRKLCAVIMTFAAVSSFCLTARAAGTVRYDGGADRFLFAPGSAASPTDLFPTFKNVMPGDTHIDSVEIRVDGESGKTTEVFLRAVGTESESVAGFLRQLRLRVTTADGRAVMDGTLDQATEYVSLGIFSPGGREQLDLTLYVPIGMDNPNQDAVGSLGWEFLAEERPAPEPAPTSPSGKGEVPKTGDDFPLAGTAAVMAAALTLAAVTGCSLIKKRK